MLCPILIRFLLPFPFLNISTPLFHVVLLVTSCLPNSEKSQIPNFSNCFSCIQHVSQLPCFPTSSGSFSCQFKSVQCCRPCPILLSAETLNPLSQLKTRHLQLLSSSPSNANNTPKPALLHLRFRQGMQVPRNFKQCSTHMVLHVMNIHSLNSRKISKMLLIASRNRILKSETNHLHPGKMAVTMTRKTEMFFPQFTLLSWQNTHKNTLNTL